MSKKIRAGAGNFQYGLIEGWGKGVVLADTPGVAVDSHDNVYVFTRSSEQPVVVFNPEGNIIRSWGHGMFKRPHALFIGPDDAVYCIDDRGHALLKFTPEGRLLLEISTADKPADTGYIGVLGSVVRSGPPFNNPTGVALSPEGHIIVSDGYGNARIHAFSADGKFISSFGEPGNGPGQFLLPHGVSVDCNGIIYVADRENNRIQIFKPDSSFLAEWKSPRPSSIFIDAQRNIFVTEMGNVMQESLDNKYLAVENAHPQVTVRNTDGKILAKLLPRDPEGDGLFFSPHSITEDSAGNLYVSEVPDSFTGGLAPGNRPKLHKYVRV